MKLLNNYNITVFGDSIPKGIVYENNQLKKLDNSAVNLLSKHYNININNLSAYGQTLPRLIEREIIDKYLSEIKANENNIAIISIGGNDSDYEWKNVANNPLQTHSPKTPPKDFETLLNSVIKKLKAKNIKVILTNITPVCSKKYFDNVISKTANAENIMKFLHGDVDNIYRHQELYSHIIAKCAFENNCQLLDIRQVFLSNIQYLDNFCEDGIHPNHQGHDKIAKTIIDQLGENLALI